MGYGTLSLGELLDAVGAATPAPASGTAAAYAAALGAALAELAAGVSRDDAAVAAARELRTRLGQLADEDAEAYRAFLAERNDETRARIVAVPQEISVAAAQVAALGERLVRDGKPSVAGDAQAAVELANGARRAADNLVALNQ